MLSDAQHPVTQRNNTLSGKALSNKGDGLFQLAFIKKTMLLEWKVLVNFCLSSGNLPQATSFLDAYQELPFRSTVQVIGTHNPNTAVLELLQAY